MLTRAVRPVLPATTLSPVAYAPDHLLATAVLAGAAATTVSPWLGVVVAGVLLLVVASYRQTLRAYPRDGGDYEVVTTNLGRPAGVGVGAALVVDHVLAVAVLLSVAAGYLGSLVPLLAGRETYVGCGLVVLLTLVGLRRRPGPRRWEPLVTVSFVAVVGATCLWGILRWVTGSLPAAGPAAGGEPAAGGLVGLAAVVLALRAVSAGAVMLTGVETTAHRMAAYPRPRDQVARNALLAGAAAAALLLVALLALVRRTGVTVGDATGGARGKPALEQVASVVLEDVQALVPVVVLVTVLVLLMAGARAFTGMPVLAAALARDGLMPRQLHGGGDRVAYRNTVLGLGASAAVVVLAAGADARRLLPLLLTCAFVSLTASQAAMVRHWSRELRTSVDTSERRRLLRSRVVAAAALAVTAVVLVVVLVTELLRGVWVVVLAVAGVAALMVAVRRHYARVAVELQVAEDTRWRSLPSRVHAVVLVSRVHKPTLRALSYARAARPSSLEALTVDADPEQTAQLRSDWTRLGVPVPLTVLDAPRRDVTAPVLGYVRDLRRESPRDLVVVYLPVFVVGHWWERLLHNQSAMRLATRLQSVRGVVVASVPWQLRSAELAGTDEERVEQ